MLEDKIKKRLGMYRETKARIAVLLDLKKSLVESSKRLLADDGRGIKSPSWDNIGGGGGVSNPTADGKPTSDFEDAKNDIREIEREVAECRKLTRAIDTVMLGLTDAEKWVIEGVYFRGLSCVELETLAQKSLTGYYSRRSIARLKASALKKIKKILI